MGDTSGGSPGIRALTFQELQHELRVLVDPTNACLARPIDDSPKFPILAGDPELVVVTWKGKLYSSNPMLISEESPELCHYWGDLHAQSDATVGTGDETEYFTFARDRARLDFASHQGNDFQMTDEDGKRLNQVVSQFNKTGRFVVFPGYEWSANSAAGGDRNVFFLEEGMPIIRSSTFG